ncbi:MAG: DNA replication/repair protein RecF [Bacilli bacterium]
MILENIELKFFRNYETQKIFFKNGINIIIGDNAQGKTNLLESIYFLGTTKSHRLSNNEDLINKNHKISKVIGTISDNQIKTKLEIILQEKSKIIKIDNQEVNMNEYLSKLKLIIFCPDDLELIKGSPEIRRKYLNIQISQIYKNYIKIMSDYNKLLKTRNEYIKNMKFNLKYNKDYFEIINDYYIKKAILIYQLRKKYIDKINENIGTIYYEITHSNNIFLKYVPNIIFENYDSKFMYETLKNKIFKNLNEEISYGKSLYGPHRDDFEFIFNNNNLKTYGSQGQQRAAILALKLSEIAIIYKVTQLNPILLLDDVFSEFDDTKKNNLLKYINSGLQVIITTTNILNINKKIIEKAKIFEIKDGKIEIIKGEENGKK